MDIVIDRSKYTPAMWAKFGWHAQDCLHIEGGPCLCGLEEALEDEYWEEVHKILDDEVREEILAEEAQQ